VRRRGICWLVNEWCGLVVNHVQDFRRRMSIRQVVSTGMGINKQTINRRTMLKAKRKMARWQVSVCGSSCRRVRDGDMGRKDVYISATHVNSRAILTMQSRESDEDLQECRKIKKFSKQLG
jgi:hypothetical protein